MSLPSAVFLDTSVLAGQQYNFASTSLSTFVPLAKKHSIKFLLPAPTEGEVLRQIRERSQEALKALEDARRRAPFLAKWKHFPPKTTGLVADWEVRRVATEEWQDFLKQFDVIKLDYSAINLPQIMRWYEGVMPPFREGKKRKEFPDAFAVAIVDAYAQKTGATVAVVSEDTDLKLACDRFSSLLYFKSLPSLSELLLSDDKKLSQIRHSVQEDLSLLEDAAREAAGDLHFYHGSRDYRINATKVHGVSIPDVSIVAIGSGECMLAFEGELEAEHELEWRHYG